MAKMTIAQMREREVQRLAEYHADIPTEEDLKEARRLMNSFYRLCGLAETNLYLANDSERYNTKLLKESEEKEGKWYDRLSKEFEEFAGLRLFYAGYCPSIGTVNPVTGACSEKITRYFYQ